MTYINDIFSMQTRINLPILKIYIFLMKVDNTGKIQIFVLGLTQVEHTGTTAKCLFGQTCNQNIVPMQTKIILPPSRIHIFTFKVENNGTTKILFFGLTFNYDIVPMFVTDIFPIEIQNTGTIQIFIFGLTYDYDIVPIQTASIFPPLRIDIFPMKLQSTGTIQ